MYSKLYLNYILKKDVSLYSLNPKKILLCLRACPIRKNGNRIDNLDLLIGTCAVFHKMTIITNNSTDF